MNHAATCSVRDDDNKYAVVIVSKSWIHLYQIIIVKDQTTLQWRILKISLPMLQKFPIIIPIPSLLQLYHMLLKYSRQLKLKKIKSKKFRTTGRKYGKAKDKNKYKILIEKKTMYGQKKYEKLNVVFAHELSRCHY